MKSYDFVGHFKYDVIIVKNKNALTNTEDEAIQIERHFKEDDGKELKEIIEEILKLRI